MNKKAMKDLPSPPTGRVEWLVEYNPEKYRSNQKPAGKTYNVVKAQTAYEAWKKAAITDDSGSLVPFSSCRYRIVGGK